MAKKRKYSPEQRAAVLSALLEGQALSHVAKEYKMPYSTVRRWRENQKAGRYADQDKVGDLLLQYLQTNLETLRKQAEFFCDRDWLEKQSASEVAVLHGVMSDKAIRILEAYGAHEDNNASD